MKRRIDHESTKTTIYDIPTDIWKEIYLLLEEPERLLLRLVSHTHLQSCNHINKMHPELEINYFKMYQVIGKRGTIHQLKWIQSTNVPECFKKCLDYNLAKNGFVKELRELHVGLAPFYYGYKHVINGAIVGKQLSVMRLLVELKIPLDSKFTNAIAIHGQTIFLKWLNNRQGGHELIALNLNDMLKYAAVNGHVCVFEWLDKNGFDDRYMTVGLPLGSKNNHKTQDYYVQNLNTWLGFVNYNIVETKKSSITTFACTKKGIKHPILSWYDTGEPVDT